jgi:hypothetical protein
LRRATSAETRQRSKAAVQAQASVHKDRPAPVLADAGYRVTNQSAVNAGVDSAMCAYSQPNGVPACQNFYLLGSLENELGFQGFVTSDWFATQSTQPALEAGDDMDMPGDANYGANLAAEVGNQVPRNYLDDAVERILTELFKSGLMDTGNTGCTCNTVTTPAHTASALQVAEEGTVLLKNSGSVLDIGRHLHRHRQLRSRQLPGPDRPVRKGDADPVGEPQLVSVDELYLRN